MHFSEFKLNRQLLNAIEDLGYEQATAVQEKSIPAVLGGQDVLGVAQTGTGKTAAYLLPLLRLLNYAQGNDARALILVPTRELSIQVGNSLRDLAKYTDLRFAVVFGGQGAKQQIEAIESGIDILVASPGRYLELYDQGHINARKIRHLVLDEAERLMDKSFIRQFHRILETMPQKRQNLLFSATMSELVRKIAGDFLDFPVEINIRPEQKTADTVSQAWYDTPNLRSKLNLIEHLLSDEEQWKKVIIFCRSKQYASDIGKYLQRLFKEENVLVIHGNKTQQTRINAMQRFRNEAVRILVTTDLAARGLDIPDVSHVVNFDTPLIHEDYVHRIGRTGRAFRTGHSITFVTMADEWHLRKIEGLIGQSLPKNDWPQGIGRPETLYEEKQAMLREIDQQRRKENPKFKGAFHEKRAVKKPTATKRPKRRK
ncbi:MAG: DEAD/DEAH box helicase [Sphingobacteriales bacterium]|jgi:ATP-dependent RNA helicase RhlE|nr:DEAD/DEAH box helicase [Sphingobacteriales bacterium]